MRIGTISMKHTGHTIGLKIRKKACCNDHTEAITISYCRKLHALQPSYYCNSMIENICNKFAIKHQYFFLPEDGSRLGKNKTKNKKLK